MSAGAESAGASVRTICLIGHSGCGKTSLAKALMEQCGTEVELDTSAEEQARGMSVDLSVTHHAQDGSVLYLIDTPGFGEFVEEVYKGLRAAETALLVLGGDKGVEVQTEISWEIARSMEVPALAFINRMDQDVADFRRALEQLGQLEGPFVPLQVPLREDGAFTGVVDLVSGRARRTAGTGTGKDTSVPASLQEEVALAREQLLEGLAEVDDALMEKFLGEEEISPEEIRAALKVAIKERALVPVLCGSAATGAGMEELLHLLREATPAFDDLHPAQGAFQGLVFNLASDPYLGLLAYVKLLGPVREGQAFLNLTSGAKEKVKDILRLRGGAGASSKVPQAEAGEVVALTKLGRVALGDTLAEGEGIEALELADFPRPVYSRAVVPLTQADEEKMSTALRELVRGKATLDLSLNDVTKELLLSGMGETQLAVLAERLKNRHNVSIKMNRPRVPYKETIQKVNKAQYRHKKQTGGRGQFGEVHLRVEPLNDDYEFVDEIKGGCIPQQFIPAVEKGVQEGLQQGVIAGYPITGVRVAAFYGMHHPVDSSEIAFKIAAAQALKLAVQGADPVLLEPVMKLVVWTPREYTGDLMSSLSGKRGRILGMGSEGKFERIEAEVPQAEILDYALELKSLTQGRAVFQQEFLKYQPVSSPKLAEELLQRERRDEGPS